MSAPTLDALRRDLALAELRLVSAPDSPEAVSGVRWAKVKLQAAETIEIELLRSEARRERLKRVIDPQGLFQPL